MTSYLSLRHVTKTFSGVPAVDDLSLDVDRGESVVLLGPSGCGKTTCLRMVAGFERPDVGEIELDSKLLVSGKTFVPPDKRRMAVMFQNYALWPHMTVRANVSFGPRTMKVSRSETSRRVSEVLEMVGLAAMGDRYPHELSGGQQQRVAMARAIVTEPSMLLLDEPLSNLDTRLREEMRGQLKRLRQELKITMLYVTHDQAEALSLADRLVVMNAGRIEQSGTPEEVYRRPLTTYVATALGSTNLVSVTSMTSGGTTVPAALLGGLVRDVDVSRHGPVSKGDVLTASIRPSELHLSPARAGDACLVTVISATFFGDSVQYELRAGTGESLSALGPGSQVHQPGTELSLDVDASSIAVLSN